MKRDIYIYLPFRMENKSVEGLEPDDEITSRYLDVMGDVSKYEFEDAIAKRLKRLYLGQVNIILTDDVGEKKETVQPAKLFLTHYKQVAVVTVLMRDVTQDVTDILNQSSLDDLRLEGNASKTLDQAMQKLSLTRNGQSVNCVVTDGKVDKKELVYMLAGESFHSKYVDTAIVSEEYLERAAHNIAQYQFSEIYGGEKNFVQILTKPAPEFFDRLKTSRLLLFMLELLQLQSCSIEGQNRLITEELYEDANPKNGTIEILTEGFAQSTLLWNIDNYSFSLAQTLHDKLAECVGIQRQKAMFEHNLETLKTVVEIRSRKERAKNSRKLDTFFLVFTLLQLLATIDNFVGKWVALPGAEIRGILSFCVSAGLWIAALIIFFVFKRKTLKQK